MTQANTLILKMNMSISHITVFWRTETAIFFRKPTDTIYHIQLFATPRTAACQAPGSFTISQSLLRFVFIELMMLSNHLILCCPLLLLPSIFPSMSQLFTSGGQSIAASASPSVLSGLISFGIDWFDLLAVQETLKSLLQHHSSKASVLWCLAFVMVQFSRLYLTTGKTISLTIRTFVGKVLSVLFNTLSRIVVAFPSRSKCLLILWLQFVCSDFGAQENYGYYGMSIVSFWQKKNVIFSTQKTVVRDRPMWVWILSPTITV